MGTKGKDAGGLRRAPGKSSGQGLQSESGVLSEIGRRRVDRALGQTVGELLAQDCALSGARRGPRGWRRPARAGGSTAGLGTVGPRDIRPSCPQNLLRGHFGRKERDLVKALQSLWQGLEGCPSLHSTPVYEVGGRFRGTDLLAVTLSC